MLITLSLLASLAAPQDSSAVAKLVDATIDDRHEGLVDAPEALLAALEELGVDTPEEIEAALRAPRASYPDAKDLAGKTTTHDVDCYHVDYSSQFVLYVPKDYDPSKRYSLVMVGHGGNSSMSQEYATKTARSYLAAYAPGICSTMDAIVAAPISERGWGYIGYSLIFSTISKVQRMANIDPNRVYVTGQSMGGHLSYRMALLFPDAFGAVSPHSGGYDFAAKGSISNLHNVPGMSVFGAREPYGINKDNKANEAWANANGLDWTFVEKNGGHEIYADEIGPMAEFFAARPRHPYPRRVVLKHGGMMLFQKTWNIEGWPEHTVHWRTRSMVWNRKHWLQVSPWPFAKEPANVVAEYKGDNRFEITSTNVKKMQIFVHPSFVDMDKPVIVMVNGAEAFRGVVDVDRLGMVKRVCRTDDRGKIDWGQIQVTANPDGTPKAPNETGAQKDR